MDYPRLIVIFTSIIYEALPFVVLGVVLAGLLEEFVPQQLIARLIPKRKLFTVGAIALGGLLGLLFPMCECGIIPVMRRLLRKGIPLSVCVCYVLAGPIINVVVISSTLAAFSGQTQDAGSLEVQLPWEYEARYIPFNAVVAGMRVGLGYIIAFTTSLIVEWQWRKHGTSLLAPIVIKDMHTGAEADGEDNGKKRTWFQRLGNISETSLHDFVDIMAFLVLGAFLAAVGRLIFGNLNLDRLIVTTEMQNGVPVVVEGRYWVAILLMMGFAVAFCLCSEADAFVAANFQPIALWPLSSKVAFLVLGPMLDFKLYLMYTRVFHRRLIFTIITAVVIQVFLYSLLVHFVSETYLGYHWNPPVSAKQ